MRTKEEYIKNSSLYRFKNTSMYLSIKDKLPILAALVIICIFVGLIEKNFATFDNAIIILRNSSINAIIAFGMTFVILMGGIDLSIPGVMASSGILSSYLLKTMVDNSLLKAETLSSSQIFFFVSISIIAGVALGVIFGLIGGTFSTKLKIAPFIVTLGLAYITRGIALLLTRGAVVSITVQAFNEFGNGILFGFLPTQIFYMLIIFVIMFVVLNKTKYGKHIYAIGGNEQTARYSGIPVDKIKISSYVIVGGLSAFGGILVTARLNSGQPTIGQNSELDAIAAVILGGTSFSGGIGTLGGTLIGAIILYVIQNGLNLLGVDQFWQPIAKGIVILIAVVIDRLKNNQFKV